MKKRFVLWAPLLLAACGPSPQPAGPPAAVALAGPIEPPPIYALIGHRQTLELTSQQVVALDSIGQHVNSVNSPLVMRLREIRGEFRGRGVDTRSGEAVPPTEEARTLLERILQNNRDATAGVRATLTTDQQTRTCELFRETEQQRQRRADLRRDQEARGRGQRRPIGGYPRLELPPTWPWCAAQPGAADTAAARG